jgi:hypothetical protein
MSAQATPGAPGRLGALRARGAQNKLSVVMTTLIVIGALAVPFVFEEGSPEMNNAVLAAAYVVMALGLNIIVGFAGCSTSGTSRSSPSARTRRATSRRASGRTPVAARASTCSSASPRRACPAST